MQERWSRWLAGRVSGFSSAGRLAALAVLLALAALATVHSPLRAQADGRSVSVHGSLGVGGYWSDESFNGNGFGFGGALDYFPTSVLGLELSIDGGTHSRDFESGVRIEGSTVYVSASLLLRFSRSRVQPYLVGGVGLLHSSTDRLEPDPRFDLEDESDEDSVVGNLGLGLFLFLGPEVSVRPEFRVVGYNDSSPVTYYYRASVAVGYHF